MVINMAKKNGCIKELIRTCSTQIELPKGQMIHFPGRFQPLLYC